MERSRNVVELRGFQPGDVVTRGGDDRHRVESVTEDGYAMTVVCIKAPAAGWCKVGEEEYNLCRRYSFAGEVVDAEYGKSMGRT